MSKQTNTHYPGFTLVEMLVVVPIVVVVIGVIIGLMTTLVGDVANSNGSSQLMYDAQDALGRIEQDALLSSAFLPSFTPSSPQDINNAGATAFTSASGTSTAIIMNSYATTANPMAAARQIVYYASPNSCSQVYQANSPFYTKTIYFVKNSVLYRRMIVPTNNQNATVDANTTCAAPWQRGSCAQGVTGALCQSVDSSLVSGVSNLTLSYYNKAAPSTSVSPDVADTVKVTLTVNKMIGGSQTTFTLSTAASLINN